MDADSPLIFSAAYLANPDLQWVFGLRVDPLSSYPVIPALGVRWKFADQWTLQAILPRPRLEYELDERFQVHLGADVELGTFRMGKSFGDDRPWPELSGAILDYFAIRVGPGFSWKIRPNLTVEVDAGCMVYRQFEYGGQNLTFRSDPAAYVQIGCQFRF